jgi:hypothetical protein
MADLPPRMTHSKSERCPHLAEEFQHEVAEGTCCSFDGEALKNDLTFWGAEDLAARVDLGMTAEEALAFSSALTALARAAADVTDSDEGALAAYGGLCAAAEWYQSLAGAGFGVHVRGRRRKAY